MAITSDKLDIRYLGCSNLAVPDIFLFIFLGLISEFYLFKITKKYSYEFSLLNAHFLFWACNSIGDMVLNI